MGSSLLEANVPLVGQPITLLDYAIVAIAQCHCGDGGLTPIKVVIGPEGASKATCPTCHTTYLAQSMGVNNQGVLGLGFTIERSRES